MGQAATPLAARQLRKKYARLSSQGHFGGAAGLQELSDLCDGLLESTPDDIRIVAFVLKVLFGKLADQANTLMPDPASANIWPKLDAAILEATAYLETGTDPAEAVRIAGKLITFGRVWIGP
jgi:hypothetical protein